ncbi:MAG TPA: benzoate-CoA ligase family protein [Candidatus Dormibacteraeota bacterium]|nr:benzoate-CoA ligase family protein [Candidatus Dormibacteraeota bacterium]
MGIWSTAELPLRYNAGADLLDGNLEAGRGDKIAIRATDGAEQTYAEVAAGANRMGNALREHGVEIENRVLIAALDCPEFVATFFGAIKLGAVPVPVNTNLKAQDYAYLLNDSRAKVAVVSASLVDAFRQVGKLTHLRHLVVIGDAQPGELSFAEITETASDTLDPADTSRDDMCFWLYSSGTTGFPKGVVHLQHDMRYVVENYGKPVLRIAEADVTFSIAKLYFAYGLGNALYMPFGVGASTVLLAGSPAPATVLDVVRHFRPTIYYGVPTSYANVLAADPEVWANADFGSVRICVSAGEPLAGSILARWKARTGADILDGIGSTECCHIFISNKIDDVRPDCSGTVVPGYEVRIIDDTGDDVQPGEVGSLLVKGDSICSSYWNQHDRTKRTIRGEWIDTGDKYLHDADGYFRYQGRSDDMLKVGGIFVSPTEVEAVVNAHDAVLECAVVGVIDEQRLVRPEAYVVLKPGRAATVELEEELRQHVRERLAHFKCPRDFHFVDELPKTATGKIQRFKLREQPAVPTTAV